MKQTSYKRTKRIMASILAFVILFTSSGFEVLAEGMDEKVGFPQEATQVIEEVQEDTTTETEAAGVFPGIQLYSLDLDNETITLNTAGDFLELANAPAQDYQYKTIEVAPHTDGDAALTLVGTGFTGFGSEDYPFAGTIKVSGEYTGYITLDSALFQALSQDASFANVLNLEAGGNMTAPLLAEHFTAGASEATISLNIHFAEVESETEDKVEYSSFGGIVGTMDEGAVLGLAIDNQFFAGQTVISGQGNRGFFCNTMEEGASLTILGYEGRADYSVVSTDGNAGAIVGEMREGAALVMDEVFPFAGSVTGAMNAGGIVGCADTKNTVSIQKNYALNGSSITSPNHNAGGLFGYAKDVILNVDDGKTVSVNVSLSAQENVGGISGRYDMSIDAAVDISNINCESVKMTAGVYAGGLFGVLENTSENQTIRIEKATNVNPINATASGVTHFGGVIGKYSASDLRTTLDLENLTVAPKRTDEMTSYGGVIAEVDSGCYIKMNSLTVEMGKNAVGGTCFGGLIANSMGDSLIDAQNVSVAINTAAANNTATSFGGLIGNLADGVLRLSGLTDVSGVVPAAVGSGYGQVVGSRGTGLVYAMGTGNEYNAETNTGWKLVRNGSGLFVSDIGTWGEIIRVDGSKLKETQAVTANDTENLFCYDTENHTVTINGFLAYGENSNRGHIATAQNFAALALSYQCGQTAPEGALRLSTSMGLGWWIYLDADVDLTDTGITGFLRDDGSLGLFVGKLDGQNHKVTLDAGDVYGVLADGTPCTQTMNGCGQIYDHKLNGLFANVGNSNGNNGIKNITVDGNIYYGLSTTQEIWAGGIAANQASATAEYTNVTSNVKMTINGNTSGMKVTRAGGFLGYVSSGATVKLNHCTWAGTFENKSTAYDYYLGGFVGCMGNASGTNGSISLENECIIAGTITTENVTTASMVGGLLAATENNGNGKITITASDLTVDGMQISTGSTGSTGGFLGYDWHNVDFTADGLLINNSDLKATKAGFGGLVYQASGVWNVIGNGIEYGEGVSLTGRSEAEIPSALLVCRGDDVYFENNTLKDYALYLNVGDDCYHVDDSLELTISGAYFDELVGVTISDNGNGVVSIDTKNNALLNRTGCNSYQKQLSQDYNNPHTRYYYNLSQYDKADSSVTSGEEMVMWSVGQYCEKNLADNFSTSRGGAVSISETIDLQGLSYYPIDYVGKIELNNAVLIFDFETIEKYELQANNKSLQDENRQHHMMHMGLFQDVKTTLNEESAITISGADGLTLQGNIGQMANGEGSGVLVAGTLEGVSSGVDDFYVHFSDTAILLDGIYVYGANNSTVYAPLLINKIGSYASVSLADVITSEKYYANSDTRLAATSLLGEIGSKDAVKIAIGFADMKLNSYTEKQSVLLYNTDKSIFSKAVFAESFRYAEGDTASAGNYNFSEIDSVSLEGGTATGNVTYGLEISNTDSGRNMAGQYYYSDGGEVCDVITGCKAETSEHNFLSGLYLRYVYVAENENGDAWNHEFDINQLAEDILFGCGTYDDPYIITEGKQLQSLASFLDAGVIANWNLTINYAIASGTLAEDLSLATHKDGSDDYLFTSGSAVWKSNDSAKTLSKEEVRAYLRNAYYVIAKDITLDSSFSGLGGYAPSLNVFSGVIVGNKAVITEDAEGNIVSIDGMSGEIPTITINAPMKSMKQYGGIVRFGNGCVLRNINIHFNSPVILESFTAPAGKEPQYQVFFGGALGYALGGDNIIDRVNLLDTEGIVKAIGSEDYYPDHDVTDSKVYLANIGGYVGLVGGSITEGGGVIFKNMEDCGKLTSLEYEVNGGRQYEEYGTVYEYSKISEELSKWKSGYAYWGVKTTAASGSNLVAYNKVKVKYSTEETKRTIQINPEYFDKYDFCYYIVNGDNLINNSLILWKEEIKESNTVVDFSSWFDLLGISGTTELRLFVTASPNENNQELMNSTAAQKDRKEMVKIDGVVLNLSSVSGKFLMNDKAALCTGGSNNYGLYRSFELSELASSASDTISLSSEEGMLVYVTDAAALATTTTAMRINLQNVNYVKAGKAFSFVPEENGITDLHGKYLVVLTNRTYNVTNFVARLAKHLQGLHFAIKVNGTQVYSLDEKLQGWENLHYATGDFTLADGVIRSVNNNSETSGQDKRYYQVIPITEDMTEITATTGTTTNVQQIKYYIVDDSSLVDAHVLESLTTDGNYVFRMSQAKLQKFVGNYLIIMIGQNGSTKDSFCTSTVYFSIKVSHVNEEVNEKEMMCNSQNVALEKRDGNEAFYWNPYIGRVLDGFACYSGTGKLDNTDKNYTIPTLQKEANKLSLSNTVISVESQQQLWVLSAIVNSGAAAYSASKKQYDSTSNAYYYGKTRTGEYDTVGMEDGDSSVILDEMNWGGMVPANPAKKVAYLIYHFADTQDANNYYLLSQLTSDEKAYSLKFDSELDMSSYGNGFRGIGSAYQDNAFAEVKKRALPLNGVDGQNHFVKLNRSLYEYSDDRDCWWAQGLGLFPVVYFKSTATVKNLTVKGSIICSYKDQSVSYTGYIGEASAGGLSGMTANGAGNIAVTFNNVHADELTVEGMKYAGGFIGVIGKSSRINADEFTVVSTVVGNYTFTSCGYNNLTVKGAYSAGGFVGTYKNDGKTVKIGGITELRDATIEWIKDSCAEMFAANPTALGKEVSTTEKACKVEGYSGGGGMFGYYYGGNCTVNSGASDKVLIHAMSLYGPQFQYNCDYGLGCFIGLQPSGELTAKNITIEDSAIEVKIDPNYVGPHTEEGGNDKYYTTPACGLIKGYSKTKTTLTNIKADRCSVINAGYCGGILGNQTDKEIAFSQVSLTDCLIYTEGSGSYAGCAKVGGVVGGLSGNPSTFTDITLTNTTVVSDGNTGLIIGMLQPSKTVKGTNILIDNCKTVTTQNIQNQYYLGGVTDPGFAQKGFGVSKISTDTMAGSAGLICGADKNNSSGVVDGSDNLQVYNMLVNNTTVGYYCAGWKQLEYAREPEGTADKLVDKTTKSVIQFTPSQVGVYVNNDSGLPYSEIPANELGNYSNGYVGVITGGQGDGGTIKVVGLSVQGGYLPYEENGNSNYKINTDANNYLIYADYLGAAAAETPNHTGTIASDYTKVTAANSPYVVVNPAPAASMTVYESQSIKNGALLTGDGMVDGAHNAIISDLALEDGEAGNKAYNLRYRHIKDVASKFMPADDNSNYRNYLVKYSVAGDSTLSAAPFNSALDDFDVLMIDTTSSAEITEMVNSYISVLTNCNQTNDGTSKNLLRYTTIKAATYCWDASGKFVRAQKDSLVINADKSISVRTGAHDNQKNQLTVLDVFYANPNNTSQGYHLFIPVVVRKVLATEFDIRMLNGSSDYAAAYTSNTAILASYGENFTMQLTYRYIWTAEEWNANIASGINFLWSYDKQIKLGNKKGSLGNNSTRYTLVDMNRRGQGNTFFIGDGSYLEEGTDAVLKFNELDDYSSVYLSDLLNITVSDVDGNMKKIEKNEESGTYPGATIRVWNKETKDYDYYRPKTDADDSEETYYSLTVGTGTEEVPVTEVYYLTVNCKEGSGVITQDATLGLNKMESEDEKALPSKMKTKPGTKQYTLGNFYVLQNVSIESKGEDNMPSGQIVLGRNDYINLSLNATISVPDEQRDNFNAYAKNDDAFLRFAIQMHNDGDTGSDMIDPSYIDALSVMINDTLVAPADYSVSLVNGICYLTIHKKGSDLLGAKVKAVIQLNYENDAAKISNQFPMRSNSNDTYGINFSMNAAVAYSEDGLDGSTMTGSAYDLDKFYREDITIARLTYNSYNRTSEDGNTSQLGINGREVQDADGQTITSLGMYDATQVNGLELKDTSSEKYPTKLECKLRLARKNDAGNYVAVNIEDYLENVQLVGTNTLFSLNDNHEYVFTIPLSEEQVAMLSEEPLEINLSYFINSDTTLEELGTIKQYANYKVTLVAELQNEEGTALVDAVEDYIIYTNAKFYLGILSTTDFDAQ